MKAEITKNEATWIASKSESVLAQTMVEAGNEFSISTTDYRNIHLTVDSQTIKITVK